MAGSRTATSASSRRPGRPREARRRAALPPQVGVCGRRLALSPPPGAARELARGDGRAIHDGAISSKVIPNMSWSTNASRSPAPASRGRRSAPGRRSRRAWRAPRACDLTAQLRGRSGPARACPGTAPGATRASAACQADARHDRRQPSPQVGDSADIRAAQSDPGFLDRVVRLADKSEHTIRDGPHVRPVLFELLGEPLGCGHRSRFQQ